MSKKKEIQSEKFFCDGREYVKTAPITFQKLIKVEDMCEEVKPLLVDFANEFGTEKDVSLKDVMKFLEDSGNYEPSEDIEWLKKKGFIKEAETELYKLKTKFWIGKGVGKKEVMVISSEENTIRLLDLSTGCCHPFGFWIEWTGRKDSISRTDLWEMLADMQEDEFTKFLSTAH